MAGVGWGDWVPQQQGQVAIQTGAGDLVRQGFANAQEYASNAVSNAEAFLGQLTTAAAELDNLPVVDVSLPTPNTQLTPFVAPMLPAEPPGMSVNMPNAPVDPTLTPVVPLDVSDAPDFTAVSPEIDLSFPAPGALQATVPDRPTLNEIVIPEAPDVALPNVPALTDIEVPVAPLLNLPTFTAVLPDSPLAPDYVFAFREEGYSSINLDVMREALHGWLLGDASGIDPAVEGRIWDRSRTREYNTLRRREREIFSTYASRGFSRPPGVVALDLQAVNQEVQSQMAGASREVAIKQADLEQSNRRWAFDLTWQIESGLIQYQNQMAQRAFEAARYVQQVAIEIYQVQASIFTGQIQAFAAKVEAYRAQLQAELSRLDVYRAELEGQRLIGQLNEQAVNIYATQVTAARTIVDIFRAKVEATNAIASVNRSIIDAYAADVGAFAEQVRAKAAEYDGYATRVRAETSKVDIFRAQADAYRSTVQGYAETISAKARAKDSELRIGQEIPMQLFQARTAVFDTQVRAETARAGAVAENYRTRTGAYTAQVQGESERTRSETAAYGAETQFAQSEGQLRVESARQNVQSLIEKVRLLIEAIRGGSQVQAQLAASALASVNLSGQIGDTSSTTSSLSNSNASTYGISQSTTASVSTSSSTSEVESNSRSTVQNTSNSTSTNTNTNYNYSGSA